jgi:EmrB/QacA subfamily drug resistance transporter
MCFALALVVSAVASLNLALPELASGLGATETELQWAVDAYALLFAGLLLPAGALGDRYGRRGVLIAGLVLFGGAYAVAATASSPELLIAMRALAGVGAALIMPVTLSVITTAFPAEERSRAVAVWAGVAGAGAMLGLLLSGTLLELTSWPWVFAASAVWAALTLVAVLRIVPPSRDEVRPALDPLGAALSVAGLTALVFAIIEGPTRGWTDGIVLGTGIGGAIALVAFVGWELRTKRPMLDPRLFRSRGFSAGSLSITLQFFALFGFLFAIVPFVQSVLGYSPLQAALAMVPMALAVGGLSRVLSPRLAERLGLRAVTALGLVVMAGGLVVCSSLEAGASYLHLLAGLLLTGAGAGLATAPATSAIVSSLPADRQGVASAVNDTARELGGALGIAVVGSVLKAQGLSEALLVAAGVLAVGAVLITLRGPRHAGATAPEGRALSVPAAA